MSAVAHPSGPEIPPRVWEMFDKDVREHRLRQEARVTEFGHVREPVHVSDYRGYRIVAVRNRIYYSKKWRFFADFLMEYGRLRFGQEWFEAQNATALENQPPIHIWRRQAYEFIRIYQSPAQKGGWSHCDHTERPGCRMQQLLLRPVYRR